MDARRALVALLLAFLFSAAAWAKPLSVSQARSLLQTQAFDEVYLAYASLEPGVHPDGDESVAQVLNDAAQQALDAHDPSLALGLSDIARKLSPKSLVACLVNADAAIALNQREAAEHALDRALQLAPRDGDVLYRRAAYAEEERQPELAAKLFQRVPESHARYADAQENAARLNRTMAEMASDLRALAEAEAEQKRRQQEAGKTAGTTGASTSTLANEGPSPLPAGMTDRSSRHFRIVYQGGARDFAERAQYEQRVLTLFEKAHAQVRTLLGRATTEPVDVVLYTQEEFHLHFGSMFGGGVLGFYSGKIRMNRAEKLDEQFYATAVHEYVHAVVDALSNRTGNVPVWLNEGLARWTERRVAGGDYVNWHERRELKAFANRGLLPSFEQLDAPFGQMGPLVGVAYAKSSAGVEALSSGGGLAKLVGVVESVGSGQPFEKAFAQAFGETRLQRLDGDVEQLVGR